MPHSQDNSNPALDGQDHKWSTRPSVYDIAVKSLPERKDWWEPCPQTIIRLKTPSAGLCIVLSDIHFPYEDKRAIKLVLNRVRGHVKAGGLVDTIVLNGDIIDNYELSRHDKLPGRTPQSLKDELDSVRPFVLELRKYCKQLVWIMGNHENRFWTKVVENPGLYGVCDSFNQLANIPDDIMCIPYGTMALWGDTLIDHGEVTASNVSAAAWRRFKSQMVLGHSHRSSTYMETHPVTKERQYVVAQGTLCDFSKVDFTRQPPWNLGWAEIYSWKDANGNLRTRPTQREIEGYSICIDGKVYKS